MDVMKKMIYFGLIPDLAHNNKRHQERYVCARYYSSETLSAKMDEHGAMDDDMLLSAFWERSRC